MDNKNPGEKKIGKGRGTKRVTDSEVEVSKTSRKTKTQEVAKNSPSEPTQPVQPVQPVQIAKPAQPVQIAKPAQPVQPSSMRIEKSSPEAVPHKPAQFSKTPLPGRQQSRFSGERKPAAPRGAPRGNFGKGKNWKDGKGFAAKPKSQKTPNVVPAKVKTLITSHNLSPRSAFQVAQGLCTIEQGLKEDAKRVERRKQAEELCKKYPFFDMSLACHILKEGISPEQFLEKKKEVQSRHQNRQQDQKNTMAGDSQQKPAFDFLVKLGQEKTPLELARYGFGQFSGYLKDFGPYEFVLIPEKVSPDTPDQIPLEIHRLKLKYFYEKRYSETVKKWIVIDKAIQKKKVRPNYRPTNRYQFPEGVLQNGAEIMLALHEGEMIRGKIIWFTPYDIFLQAGKAEIWVFRHSIADCALIRKPQ